MPPPPVDTSSCRSFTGTACCRQQVLATSANDNISNWIAVKCDVISSRELMEGIDTSVEAPADGLRRLTCHLPCVCVCAERSVGLRGGGLTRVSCPRPRPQRGKSSSCACTLRPAWSLSDPGLQVDNRPHSESEQRHNRTDTQQSAQINTTRPETRVPPRGG